MSTTTLVTAEEFACMSFDVPVELIKGEIVEMTNPGGWHGKICIRIGHLLEAWAEPDFEYEVFSNDTGIVLERSPDTVRGPDLFVIRSDRLPGGKIPEFLIDVPPDVAIEVRSPSNRWSQIREKVSQFLAAGIQEVWVIDPRSRRVHVYRAGNDEPEILNQHDRLTSALLPGFECNVGNLFQQLG
jgi:Uma2 family endonuclease